MPKLRKDVVLEQVCGCYILVALRPAWKEYPFAMQISGSSALLWRCVRDGKSKEETLSLLEKKYGQSPERAEWQYGKFLDYCRDNNYFVSEEES